MRNHAKIYFVYIYFIFRLIWSTQDINPFPTRLVLSRGTCNTTLVPGYVRILSYLHGTDNVCMMCQMWHVADGKSLNLMVNGKIYLKPKENTVSKLQIQRNKFKLVQKNTTKFNFIKTKKKKKKIDTLSCKFKLNHLFWEKVYVSFQTIT
jgi:hypothetical protein